MMENAEMVTDCCEAMTVCDEVFWSVKWALLSSRGLKQG